MCSIMFFPFSIYAFCVCVCVNVVFTTSILLLTFFIIVFFFLFFFLLMKLMQLTLITKERRKKAKWEENKLNENVNTLFFGVFVLTVVNSCTHRSHLCLRKIAWDWLFRWDGQAFILCIRAQSFRCFEK